MVEAMNVAEQSRRSEVPERSGRHTILLVVMIALITEIMAFEFTMVGVGLPDIAAAFQTTQVALTMTVPLLVAGVTVPLLSKLADIHGKKKLVLIGSGAFLVGSLLCAVTPSFPLFLFGRGLQGLGMLGTVVCIGLIRDLAPPRYVPLALGAIGVGTGTSALLGPLLGGWLVENHGFRSCFWFLLCYMAVTALVLAVFVPESPVRINHRIDLVGAVLLGLGAGSLIVASVRADLRVAGIVVGVVLLAVFFGVERRREQPLVAVSLLSRPAVWTTLLVGLFLGFVSGANAVLAPQMLRAPHLPGVAESGLGLDAMQYAFTFALPQGIAGTLFGFLAGWISRKYAPRTALIGAATLLTASSAVAAAGLVDTRAMAVVAGALLGGGIGMYYASSANLIVEAVPANTQSVSQAMKFTVEQVTGAIASAIAGAIIAAHVLTYIPEKRFAVLSMDGFRIAYLVCTVAGLLGLLVAAWMRTGRAPSTGGVAPGHG